MDLGVWDFDFDVFFFCIFFFFPLQRLMFAPTCWALLGTYTYKYFVCTLFRRFMLTLILGTIYMDTLFFSLLNLDYQSIRSIGSGISPSG